MATGAQLLRVFVYGTLKRGQCNHLRYCHALADARPAKVWGRLWHLPQGYPMLEFPLSAVLAMGTADAWADVREQARHQALIQANAVDPRAISSGAQCIADTVGSTAGEKANSADWQLVAGELLSFSDPVRALPPLDTLEDYVPGQRSVYWRVLVRLAEPANTLAWTYIAPNGLLPAGANFWGAVWP